MIVYKLFRRLKNGGLRPLFIERKREILLGEWHEANSVPTKGFKYRPGWHACLKPEAPHLSEKGRVWVKCEVREWTIHDRPPSQGGQWILANRIKPIEILD